MTKIYVKKSDLLLNITKLFILLIILFLSSCSFDFETEIDYQHKDYKCINLGTLEDVYFYFEIEIDYQHKDYECINLGTLEDAYFYINGYGYVDAVAYYYISKYGLVGAAAMQMFRPNFARLDLGNDVFTVCINEVFANYVFTERVSDEIYMRVIVSSNEVFVLDFLQRSCTFVELKDLNNPLDLMFVLFIFNTDITNFQYIELCHTPKDDINYMFISEILYSTETLKANVPFVVNFIWQGHKPTRGVMFYDENNNSRIYLFWEHFVGGYWPSFNITEFFINR